MIVFSQSSLWDRRRGWGGGADPQPEICSSLHSPRGEKSKASSVIPETSRKAGWDGVNEKLPAISWALRVRNKAHGRNGSKRHEPGTGATVRSGS